ncbi:hypothetical protein M9H77_20641 [Catharanthus roseus]|uniref:Uncharacterized protein n=1 Tax=Catharanthus roseus TaxID=4058 RepID=A0ACC0AK51_CATRO|nr:hypothetical protein M9H77_20641 [Catharanthus roseus]
MKSREHKVTTYNLREGIYMVKSPIQVSGTGNNVYTLRINNKSCSCGKWQRYTLPCSHVLAVCRENESRADTYVTKIYSRQTYRITYQANFHPVLSENFWRDVPFNLTFYPSNMKKERDKKQDKRFQRKWIIEILILPQDVADVACWDIIEKIVIILDQASISSLWRTLLRRPSFNFKFVVDLTSTFGANFYFSIMEIKDYDKPHRHIFIIDTQRGSRTRPLSVEVFPALIEVSRIGTYDTSKAIKVKLPSSTRTLPTIRVGSSSKAPKKTSALTIPKANPPCNASNPIMIASGSQSNTDVDGNHH